MATKTMNLSFPESDIAVLAIDLADRGANVLSRSVLEELSDQLDTLETRVDLAGLIITSGKPGQFVAGADLREFAENIDISHEGATEICRQGQRLFKRLTMCPFITVAAVDGVCVGGGAELAAWCDRRVMTNNPKTQFGFPEVKLGLFPGWGGTMRAPRMVGLSNAVEMITGGESISGKEAFAMGWACDLVDPNDLMPAAIRAVRSEQATGEYLLDRERWSGPIDISDTELGFLGAAASALIQKHTRGQYPAPVSVLEIMLGGAHVDADTACQMEAEGMAGLFGSPINRSLLNIFFLTDRNKKDSGVTDDSIQPAEIKSAGIIGAGIMGAGIAAANVRRKIPVNISDTRHEALMKGVQKVLEEVSYNRDIKGQDVQRAFEFGPLVNGTMSPAEVATSDVVIEAAVENKDIKKQIFAGMEPLMREDAILGSNTSTIPISELAAELQRPEQFCGIHFFNPVRKMKLVEVIRGKKTSDETVATAVAYVKRLGKMPIVCNDGPGFLVNRLLMPYMNEAAELVLSGADLAAVEKAAKSFGMPMGPFELYDMVGLDTAVYSGKVLCDAFPDRFSGNDLLPALVEAGRLGRKSGAGFYSYHNRKKKPEPDPELETFLAKYRTSAATKFDRKQLTNRLFLPMLVEATRILEEHIVRDPRDIDLGMIFGTGFPPFKGGLMFWADTMGAATVVEMLKPLESLGNRVKPTELLLEKADQGGTFYA